MFSSLKTKLLLGVYVFLLLSIPVGAFLVSQTQNPNTSAKQPAKSPKASLLPLKNDSKLSPVDEIKQLTSPDDSGSTNPDASGSGATTFGPTLNLKIDIEGRPVGQMATKLFVGIADNTASTLKYLLSFTVDIPANGVFNGISLAGLEAGSSYKAILKGPAQLATSSAFVMSPGTTELNSSIPVYLFSGDLNEDNLVNSADYSIIKSAFGSKSGEAGWNENTDLNKDGVINAIDLSIVYKNFGKTGASGIWVSTPPATSSGTISPIGGPDSTSSGGPASPPGGSTPPPPGAPTQTDGYWFWMPKL